MGTIAGAVAIPRGPGAAGLNRRGLRTPRAKLSTGQPHARPAWRGSGDAAQGRAACNSAAAATRACRRGVRRLRVRPARTALPGRGAVRLGGGARGHPAQRSAGAAHAVAGQAQLAGGAVPRAACRPAVGPGSRLAYCSALYHLKPTFVVASRPPVAPAFCRVAAADLFATVDGYWVVPHTFRDGLCDDEY